MVLSVKKPPKERGKSIQFVIIVYRKQQNRVLTVDTELQTLQTVTIHAREWKKS